MQACFERADNFFIRSKRIFSAELDEYDEKFHQIPDDWSLPNSFARDCLRSHNHFRAQHSCPPLQLSSEISEFSQRWAHQIAREDHLRHSHHPVYGENLFAVYCSEPYARVAGDQVVESWYSEHALWPNTHPVPSKELLLKAGHFTQVVWSRSRRLGIGKAVSRSNRLYVVANYYPAGNVLKAVFENVPRRILRTQYYAERRLSRRTACLLTP